MKKYFITGIIAISMLLSSCSEKALDANAIQTAGAVSEAALTPVTPAESGSAIPAVVPSDLNGVGIPEETSSSLSQREQNWLEDIAFLRDEYSKLHINLFFRQSREYYNNYLDDLSGETNNLNDFEIIAEIEKLIASMGDMHSRVWYTPSDRYPFYIEKIGDGYYITYLYKEAGSEIDTKSLYCRIAAVNGVDIKWIVQELSPYISGDSNIGFIESWLAQYLQFPDYLKLAQVPFEDNLEVVLTLIDADGKTFECLFNIMNPGLEYEAYNERVSPDYINENEGKSFWFHYFADEKVMYLKLIRFTNIDEPITAIDETYKAMFEAIRENDVKTLVFDVRNNLGGGFNLYFLEQRANYPELFLNPGHFYYVTNNLSASASVSTLNLLRSRRFMLTHIGEPPGTTAYGDFADPKMVKLPKSELTLSYSKERTAKKDPTVFGSIPEWDYTIFPDIYVTPTIEAYKEGRDEVLEWIFSHN